MGSSFGDQTKVKVIDGQVVHIKLQRDVIGRNLFINYETK